MDRSWTAGIRGVTTTIFVEIQRVQPRTMRLSAVPPAEMVMGYGGYKSPVCTAYTISPKAWCTATALAVTGRTPCTTCTTGNKQKEKQLGTLRQLADSLGLSSEPKPAPRTTTIEPVANDSSMPTERTDTGPARHIVTAATASNEWRQARDQYLNHLMACRACYAPTGRHCAAGSALSQQYRSTPMESLHEPERTAVPRPISLRSPVLDVSLGQPRG